MKMTTDDECEYFDEFITRKKKRNDKWGERFTMQGGHGIYVVSRATYGKMSPTGEWGCIESIACLCERLDKIPEDEMGAEVEFRVDGELAWAYQGRKAISRTEMLTGVRRDAWVMTHWSTLATSIPTVFYDVGKHVRLIVTYRRFGDDDRVQA